MLTTSQPAAANQRDSARVEKRGPWITTTVPPLTTGMPSSSALAASVSPRSAQNGSAADTCVVCGPS